MQIFICEMKRVLELTIDWNLHLFWPRIRTQVSLRSLIKLSQNMYFVVQSEPKILRLV